MFRLGGWRDLFAVLGLGGARALIDRVREAEAADPDGSRFPRGKLHDDASVAFVEL